MTGTTLTTSPYRSYVYAYPHETAYRPLGGRPEGRPMLGDLTLTGCVESDADAIPKIIEEIAVARVTERGATHGDDRFSEAGMEDRKKEGYF